MQQPIVPLVQDRAQPSHHRRSFGKTIPAYPCTVSTRPRLAAALAERF